MASTLSRPYCSLSQVQRELGNHTPEIEDKLKDCINAASRAVDRICGRDFWFHDHTSSGYVVPRARVMGELVMLPFEVRTLTEVVLDDEVVDAEDYDYQVGKRVIELLEGTWGASPFRGTLTVFGTFGFPLAECASEQVPPPTLFAEVSRATTLIAAAWSHEVRKEQVAITGERISLLESRIPPEVNGLLRPFHSNLMAHF